MPYEDLNRTELIEILRELDLGNVSRLAPRTEIQRALDGEEESPTVCPLDEHRHAMERHIQKNFRRLRTQLPGCNGKCVSYGCPEGIVVRCWLAFKDDVI